MLVRPVGKIWTKASLHLQISLFCDWCVCLCCFSKTDDDDELSFFDLQYFSIICLLSETKTV